MSQDHTREMKGTIVSLQLLCLPFLDVQVFQDDKQRALRFVSMVR